MRRTTCVLAVAVSTIVAGCDALLVDPSETGAAGPELSIVAAGAGDYGDLSPVFAKVELARFDITSSAGTRDTTVAVRLDDGALTARMRLRVDEARGWVEVRAALIGEGEQLFEAELLDYAYGVASERTLSVTPVVGAILSGPAWPVMTAIGDTFVVQSQTLFGTGDTLSGVEVQWGSEDPGLVEVLGADRLVARSNGMLTMTGTALGKETSRLLTVAQVPVDVTGVAPTDTTIAVGETFYLRPFGQDVNGHPLLPGAMLAWTATGGVVVNEFGFVRGASPGPATVEVTFGGVTRTVTVQVVGS